MSCSLSMSAPTPNLSEERNASQRRILPLAFLLQHRNMHFPLLPPNIPLYPALPIMTPQHVVHSHIHARNAWI